MGCSASKAGEVLSPQIDQNKEHTIEKEQKPVAEHGEEPGGSKDAPRHTPVQPIQDTQTFKDTHKENQTVCITQNGHEHQQRESGSGLPCKHQQSSQQRTSKERDLDDIDRMLADPTMSLSSVKESNRTSPRRQRQQEEQEQQWQQQQQLQQQLLQKGLQGSEPDPWAALQSQYRPDQLARASPLYEGSPKHALLQQPSKASLPSGRGSTRSVLPPLKPLNGLAAQRAQWDTEDGEVMIIEDVGGVDIAQGPSKPKAASQASGPLHLQHSSRSKHQAAPIGPPRMGGWGDGNLAQPGTLMLDDAVTMDELEVYVEAPVLPEGQTRDEYGAEELPEVVRLSEIKPDDDLGMEDLEEIDELFAAEEARGSKSNNLESKYAKFAALADDED